MLHDTAPRIASMRPRGLPADDLILLVFPTNVPPGFNEAAGTTRG